MPDSLEPSTETTDDLNEERSPEPSTPPFPRKPQVGLKEVLSTRDMLVGFKDAVETAVFEGKKSHWVAMGLQFLNNMVDQARRDVERVKAQEKEMEKAAREAIKQAGGEVKNGSAA